MSRRDGRLVVLVRAPSFPWLRRLCGQVRKLSAGSWGGEQGDIREEGRLTALWVAEEEDGYRRGVVHLLMKLDSLCSFRSRRQ